MSELGTSLENAQYMLSSLVPDLEAGRLRRPSEIHTLCTFFRIRGVCHMLTRGTVDGLHHSQMQDASAYLYWLRSAATEEKVTSWAQPFWSAIGAGAWIVAEEIAAASRTTFNPTFEHEDDFLAVMFLMQRYCLGASVSQQERILDDYERVLAGGFDARFDVCRSLLEGNSVDFEVALLTFLESRQEKVTTQVSEGNILESHAEWVRPFCPEGLAYLRFGKRDSFSLRSDYLSIPSIARSFRDEVWVESSWKASEFPG